MSSTVSPAASAAPSPSVFPPQSTLALIGGTGMAVPAAARMVQTHSVHTPYGEPSASVLQCCLGERSLLFLQRHGSARDIPPHRVNYRANLWALKALGAEAVIAVNAVGGISSTMRPGHLVIPDQIIDYTWGREHTFDEGGQGGALLHIEFTEPYTAALRHLLLEAAARAGVSCIDGAVHGVTQGPRLETAAEIRRMARDGCDLVGMTGMPEAALARELGLPYASICMVVNAAAGLNTQPLTMPFLRATIEAEAARVNQLLAAVLAPSQPGSS